MRPPTKPCARCGKPDATARADGYCPECRKARSREQIKAAPSSQPTGSTEKVCFCGTTFVSFHRGQVNHCSPACRARMGHLKSTYGLDAEDLSRLRDSQDNRCGICGIEFGTAQHTKECVDHDHKTGKVRGLLCQKCNRGLGQFNDDSVLVGLAFEYLIREGR